MLTSKMTLARTPKVRTNSITSLCKISQLRRNLEFRSPLKFSEDLTRNRLTSQSSSPSHKRSRTRSRPDFCRLSCSADSMRLTSKLLSTLWTKRSPHKERLLSAREIRVMYFMSLNLESSAAPRSSTETTPTSRTTSQAMPLESLLCFIMLQEPPLSLLARTVNCGYSTDKLSTTLSKMHQRERDKNTKVS